MQKPQKKTFWERLKQGLQEAGKPATQTHVAKVLGIEQPSVSEWNKPGGYPEMARAVEIADYAGVCVEWLYSGKGPIRPPPFDALAQRLWSLWGRLDEATKGELVGIASKSAAPPGEDYAAAPRSA